MIISGAPVVLQTLAFAALLLPLASPFASANDCKSMVRPFLDQEGRLPRDIKLPPANPAVVNLRDCVCSNEIGEEPSHPQCAASSAAPTGGAERRAGCGDYLESYFREEGRMKLLALNPADPSASPPGKGNPLYPPGGWARKSPKVLEWYDTNKDISFTEKASCDQFRELLEHGALIEAALGTCGPEHEKKLSDRPFASSRPSTKEYQDWLVLRGRLQANGKLLANAKKNLGELLDAVKRASAP